MKALCSKTVLFNEFDFIAKFGSELLIEFRIERRSSYSRVIPTK